MYNIYKDKRKYLRLNGEPPEPHIISTCQWRQSYNYQVSMLQCELHHCGHPHLEEGSHSPPGPEYNISLVETSKTQVRNVVHLRLLVFLDGNYFNEHNSFEVSAACFISAAGNFLTSSKIILWTFSCSSLWLRTKLYLNQFIKNAHVPFNDVVMYKCDPGTFIEKQQIDPTETNITVQVRQEFWYVGIVCLFF